MSFDLANASATFQVYINNALRDLLNVCCVVYLDNILIYSSFKEQNKIDVLTVLECLQQTKLFIKFSKCEFEIIKVIFLSYVTKLENVKIKLDRIKIIEE